MSTTKFASRIGLIAATVGSAVGLGNVWRFPAEAQQNGGAAFLLVYIAWVFILGIPAMLVEFSVGRAGEGDAVTSMRNIGASRPWQRVGILGILAGYMILGFYMVVAGWTLEYMWQSITGALYSVETPGQPLKELFMTRMDSYIGGTWWPLICTWGVIILTGLILANGVQKGIERISNVLMPMLVVILLLFMVVALTLPKAGEGLAFFFDPDFSALSPQVALNALGQAFFSLSLGMGVLVTYASYFPKDTNLTRTAVTVSGLDLAVSVLMGMIIFPAVMSFGLQGEEMKGATLVFVTLPEVFAHMDFPCFWSTIFFLLLSVAAITSCISIAEVAVVWVSDRMKISRKKACVLALAPLLIISGACSLSQGPWSDFTICGLTIFNLFDTVSSNILLPIGALLLCVYVGWVHAPGLMKKELTNNGSLRCRMLPLIIFLVRWIVPVLILMVLIAGFI